MIILYRILINTLFLFTPLILAYRLIKKKEALYRFKEKFGFFSRKKMSGKLIWFHGASVGELQSIIPLLEIYEKDRSINQILVTSNTLSSLKIIKNIKLDKVIHQFFPIDVNFLAKKFVNYWKPSIAFFVDSEIWPNMIISLKKKKTPLILINGRITKKSFKRWKMFPSFSESIFGKFDLCLSSSKESFNYLKKLGSKKVKFLGNLKFTQTEKKNDIIKKNLKDFIKKKIIWCASSTHFNEEIICGNIHKYLKKNYKNLLTIIIPRHINRVKVIKKDLNNLGLNVHLDEPKCKIEKNTDIYLVNTYGKTRSFYANCKNVFLGGSLINHGGQNPLEAARYGCNILHGKYISNFQEIYKFLNSNQISHSIKTNNTLIKKLIHLFSKKNNNSSKIKNKINYIGKEILNNTKKEINLFLKK